MKKALYLFLALSTFLHSEMGMFSPSQDPTIVFKNTILATVNDQSISGMDVRKKMDLFFFQTYPQFADSIQARYQFYTLSWRSTLKEMVQTKLILSDANDREVKIGDAEIREEIERRFGPKVLVALEKMNLTYNDAWDMIKNEMLVQRMMWFFVHSKALQSITPQMLRTAYSEYLIQHPPFKEWTYQVISLPTENLALGQELSILLQQMELPPDQAIAKVSEEWNALHPDIRIQLSKEYVTKEPDLSQFYREVLADLAPISYSPSYLVKNRAKIFYLSSTKDHTAPSFESLAKELKESLVQEAMAKQSQTYLQKLSSQYGYDLEILKGLIAENQQPFFSLE